MKICPKCKNQYESGNFCENCENEDGSPVKLEEEKISCPKCGRQYSKGTKFCSECGVKLGQAGTSSNGSGISMGDKNVIAGDVIGHKETYNVSGNATIVHNEDETKKTAKCHICGSIVQKIYGYDCPDCGEFTCEDCFDKKHGICKNCVENKVKRNEENYRSKVIDFLSDDNRIDAEEFKKLHEYQEQYGISDFRAMEIQDEVKKNSRGKVEFTTFEKLNFEKAEELFYDEGRANEALELLEPIYKVHPEDEKVLSLYLPVLADNDTEKAKKIISEIKTDEIGAYLTAIEIAIQEKDMATAERRLLEAERIWPESILVKCHKVLYRLALYEQFDSEEWLEKAAELSQNLGEPTNKLELNWQVKIQCMVSEARGEEPLSFDRQFCRENQLYYGFLNKIYAFLSEEEKKNLSKDLYDNSEFDENGTILKKYNGKSKVIYIPDGINYIQEGAFAGNNYIEKLFIGNSIVEIGGSAFEACPKLEEVYLSNSLKVIGIYAFYNCSRLSKITIPNSVNEIGRYAFQNTKIKTLKSKVIQIEDGFVIQDNKLIYLTEEIKEVYIPESVIEIDDGAFSSCTSLEKVKMHDNVKKIGDQAFNDCKNLKSIELSNSLEYMGDEVFCGCSSLEELIIPDSVKQIWSCAFSECSSLKRIKLPTGITEINDVMFKNCISLEEIKLPDSISKIGNNAFEGCSSLFEVYTQGLIETVGDDVFKGCSISNFVSKNFNIINGLGIRNDELCYCSKNVSGTVIIPNNIKKIKDSAFESCELIEQIIMPDTVDELGCSCFYCCSSLNKITLSKSITEIPHNTFRGCSSLREIYLPLSIKEISIRAFSDCTSLMSVNIPDNVESIGYKAFDNCNLDDYTIQLIKKLTK